MPYNFDEALESAAAQFGSSSNFFKLEEGNENIVRVLTEGATYANQFMGQGKGYRVLYGKEKGDPLRQPDDADAKKQGRIIVPVDDKGKSQRPTIVTVVYILDRKDGRIKIAEFPYSVAKGIGALQQNPDYKFTELPMPYDLRITYKKEAAPAEKYRVEVKPGSLDLTEAELAELDRLVKEKSPEKIADAKKDRQKEDDQRNGRILSEEELAADKKDYDANMRATMVKQREAAGLSVTKDEYPGDEINPEDIPF
jgi:hypothetical protein